MDGFSGLCKWMGKMSDEWLCPPSPLSTMVSPYSPYSTPDTPRAQNDTHDSITSKEEVSVELGSSLSPLHSSREILAGYTDFTCNSCSCNYKINNRRKSRGSKLSYTTLPLAADEME